jgi:transforming growth factor-beta-induced protein
MVLRLLPVIILAACVSAQRSIVENAIATPTLSTLVSVLTLPAYKPVLDALSGAGPFTVFAPTNAAFQAAGVDPANVAVVTAVLQYHVVSGKIMSKDLQATQTVVTLNGKSIVVTSGAGGVTINGKANVTTADVNSTNGVVHIIDAVLIPPAVLQSIVANAIATPTLSTLVSVLTMPGYKPVLDILSGAGPFTVFAPSDAAFQAAGVNPNNVAALTPVLQYHVVSGKIMSKDLQQTQTVVTLNGQSIVVTKSPNGVTINGIATVITADIEATNGVIHIIDSVLIPSADNVEGSIESSESAESTEPAVFMESRESSIPSPSVLSSPSSSFESAESSVELLATSDSAPFGSSEGSDDFSR